MQQVPSTSPAPTPPQEDIESERIYEPENLPNRELDNEPDDETDGSSLPTIHLDDIRLSYKFIDLLKNASLDSRQLDSEDVDRLRNPPTELIDLVDDADFHLSLDLFLSLSNASQDAYSKVRNAILRRHPHDPILSYDQIKRRIKNLTGVIPLVNDMCINSCMAYTGPFEDLEECRYCSEPRYDSTKLKASDGLLKTPRQTSTTIPLGPQIQALWRHHDSAEKMRYCERCTTALLQQLDTGINTYNDIISGQDYLDAVTDSWICSHDTVLVMSINGAQLYRSKKSDCWIYIWVVVDLPPDERYKKHRVLPGGFIPGPNHPKNLDSFVFPGLYHLSALQREGLAIWDAARDLIFTSHPFLFVVTADAVGMTDLNGWVGHHGKFGCRLLCGLPGRHKPGVAHYYPALLKPTNYHISGCCHNNLDINELPSPNSTTYRNNLRLVIESSSV